MPYSSGSSGILSPTVNEWQRISFLIMLHSSEPSSMKLVLFIEPPSGYDYSSLCHKLRTQSKSSDHRILRWLLSESTTILQGEFRRLSAELKSDLPPFLSVLDIIQSYNWQAGSLAGPLSNAFSCLLSLCLFVG